MSEEVKLDNKIIERYHKVMNDIDNEIEDQKYIAKNLKDREEIITDISKQLAKCIDILRDSVSGKKINYELNSYELENKKKLAENLELIDIKNKIINNKIKELNNKKEDYQKMMKELTRPEEEVENKEKEKNNKEE